MTKFDLYSESAINEMIRRLKDVDEIRIHTTSVGGCMGREAFRWSGAPKLAPMHFWSAKGTVAHHIIEKNIIDGEPLRYDPDEITKVAVGRGTYVPQRLAHAIRPQVETALKNFKIWLEQTEIDLDPENLIGAEVRLESPLRGRYTLTGAIDLLTEKVIIDFKNGKKSYQKAYYKQLGNYERLCIEHELGTEFQKTLVFLGDPDGPQEYTPKAASIKSAMQFFKKELDDRMRAYDLMEQGVLPCFNPGFGCSLCPYRGICAGV